MWVCIVPTSLSIAFLMEPLLSPAFLLLGGQTPVMAKEAWAMRAMMCGLPGQVWQRLERGWSGVLKGLNGWVQ